MPFIRKFLSKKKKKKRNKTLLLDLFIYWVETCNMTVIKDGQVIKKWLFIYLTKEDIVLGKENYQVINSVIDAKNINNIR